MKKVLIIIIASIFIFLNTGFAEQMIKLKLYRGKNFEIRQVALDIEKLDLGSNQITKIEGLDNLVKLRWLDLDENQITKIKGLDKLVNLQKLHLKKNNISIFVI